jgi:hypothetical protein
MSSGKTPLDNGAHLGDTKSVAEIELPEQARARMRQYTGKVDAFLVYEYPVTRQGMLFGVVDTVRHGRHTIELAGWHEEGRNPVTIYDLRIQKAEAERKAQRMTEEAAIRAKQADRRQNVFMLGLASVLTLFVFLTLDKYVGWWLIVPGIITLGLVVDFIKGFGTSWKSTLAGALLLSLIAWGITWAVVATEQHVFTKVGVTHDVYLGIKKETVIQIGRDRYDLPEGTKTDLQYNTTLQKVRVTWSGPIASIFTGKRQARTAKLIP